MVQPLGPGKFYGSSLPRPRIYTDVKLNSERVDPPAPFSDPLLSWARESHWSMGGLSFQRLRLQGRIEGNVKRLRAQREKQIKSRSPAAKAGSESPPPAPVAMKRKRFMALVDDEEEDEEEEAVVVKKRLARRLREEFDEVADKTPVKSGRKRLRKAVERDAEEALEKGSSVSPAGTRVSSRLAKRGLGAR